MVMQREPEAAQAVELLRRAELADRDPHVEAAVGG
jgi:hypothetical protein